MEFREPIRSAGGPRPKLNSDYSETSAAVTWASLLGWTVAWIITLVAVIAKPLIGLVLAVVMSMVAYIRAASPNSRARRAFQAAAGLVRQGRHGEAVPKLTQAVELDPAYGPAQLQLGLVLHATGDHESAAKVLRTFVADHPDDMPGQLGLADCLLALGTPDAAITILERVRPDSPLYDRAQLLLGRAFATRSDHARAVDVLQRISLLNKDVPDDFRADVEYSIASSYEQLGMTNEAEEHYGRVLALDAAYPGAAAALQRLQS